MTKIPPWPSALGRCNSSLTASLASSMLITNVRPATRHRTVRRRPSLTLAVETDLLMRSAAVALIEMSGALADVDVVGIVPWHWLNLSGTVYSQWAPHMELGVECFPKVVLRLHEIGKITAVRTALKTDDELAPPAMKSDDGPEAAAPALALAAAASAVAVSVPAVRTTGEVAAAEWVDDGLTLHSLGNHRVRLKCPVSAARPVVLATAEWRRPDDFPLSHGVYVTTDPTTTAIVAEAAAVNVSRLSGSVAFDTRGGGGGQDDPGEFFIYWLPFTKNHAGQWGAVAVSYDPPKATATAAWTQQYVADGKWAHLPRCNVVAYEARDEFNRFTSMEVVSTGAEMAHLASTVGSHGRPYQVFPEDRSHPVRDFQRLPARWLPLAAAHAAGRCGSVARLGTPNPEGCDTPLTFKGTAQPGEYFVFQLVVWAQAALSDIQVLFEPLQSSRDPLRRHACASAGFLTKECSGPRLDTNRMHSINQGGTSYLGVPFTKNVSVTVGQIQPMWMALDLPLNLSAGKLYGTFTIQASNSSTGHPFSAVAVAIVIDVAGEVVSDHGDSDLSKLTRLRWLDSTEGTDNEPSMNFGGLTVVGNASSSLTLVANNKTFVIDKTTGLPVSIFVRGKPVLAAPMEFQTAVDGAGVNVRWCRAPTPDHFQLTQRAGGIVQWRAQAVACGGDPELRLIVNGSVFFDGFFDYSAELACGLLGVATAGRGADCHLQGVTLLANVSKSATKFAMGMGSRGQPWPPNASEWPIPSFPSLPPGKAGLEWWWAEAANASAHGVAPRMGWSAWIGSASHGLRLKLKGKEHAWDGPLNPIGACDAGTHTCDGITQVRIPDSWGHGTDAKLALDYAGVLTAASDGRTISHGQSVQFRFDLVTTPAKPRDPQHWHWRYLMGCGGCDVAGAQMDGATNCKPSASNFGRDVENMTLIGFNIGVIHQGCPLNPFVRFDSCITLYE